MPIQDEDRWYESYNNLQRRFSKLKDWWNLLHLRKMRFFVDVPRSAVILDAGCGNGNLLRTLSTKGYVRLHGFDLRVPARHNRPYSLKQGSMLDMPYPDNFAEIVICFNAMHHLADQGQYECFLRQCRRVLKPAGRFYLVEPESNLWRRLQDLLVRIPLLCDIGPMKGQKEAVLAEKEEIDQFMGLDIAALLAEHNFRVCLHRSYLKSFILCCRHAVTSYAVGASRRATLVPRRSAKRNPSSQK